MLLGLRVGDPHDETLGMTGKGVGERHLPDRRPEAGNDLRGQCDHRLSDRRAGLEEIESLGGTIARWRNEILNHHRGGASTGPTEGLILRVNA